jgi:dynein heavy chain
MYDLFFWEKNPVSALMYQITICFQNQVQNMMGSKYIAFFLTEVSEWQKKLSTADQVISTYLEVQRTWSHLESIFIGSEDIRNQLPEDTKRFEMIDSKFKVITAAWSFVDM